MKPQTPQTPHQIFQVAQQVPRILLPIGMLFEDFQSVLVLAAREACATVQLVINLDEIIYIEILATFT